MVGDFEYLVVDADRKRIRDILAHDVNFLDADRQTKFLSSIGVHEYIYLNFTTS